MSVESTAPVVEASEASVSEVDAAEGVDTSDSEESDSIAPEDDPNESYESWLKRYNESKKTESEKSVKSDSKEEPKAEPKEKDPEPPKKEEPKLEKIKIKDKEYSVEELEKSLSDATAVRSEYNKILQHGEQLINILKTNPGQILDRLEVNKDVIEQWYYKKYLEPELLTPEQRQAKADQEELQTRRKQDEERQAKEEEARKSQLREQYKQEISNRIRTILETAKVPESPYIAARVAQHMKDGLKPEDISTKIRQEWTEIQRNAISSLSPEEIPTTLGEEKLAQLRKIEA